MRYLVLFCLLTPLTLFAESDSRRWAFLPVIAGSAETGVQLGVYAAHFLPYDPVKSRPSSVNGAVIGSLKKQIQGIVAPDLYVLQDKYHLEGYLIVRKWPANFYGVGNNSPERPEKYDARGFELSLTLQQSPYKNIFVGPYYRLFWEDISPDNLGAFAGVRGATGFRSSGLGVWAVYDTRDNPNAARAGGFVRYTGIVYHKIFGGDAHYRVQTFEVRRYFSVGTASSLGFASYFRHVHGDVPFRDLSSPDGAFTFRGIEKGRYRDRDVLTLQSEVRFPLFGPFGMTLFGELAQVAPGPDDFSFKFNAFKTSVGGGLRYALNPEQRFNVRLDTNWVDGAFGITINVKEAF